MQATNSSDWFGMSHGQGPRASIRLEDAQPAYLEVSIDPAAHGEAGLGPIQRMIWLETESGQSLQFDLVAYVLP